MEAANHPTPEGRPTLDQWIRAVVSQIRKAAKGRLYGRIVIEVTNGRPSRLVVERSVKDPRVALDDEEPVG